MGATAEKPIFHLVKHEDEPSGIEPRKVKLDSWSRRVRNATEKMEEIPYKYQLQMRESKELKEFFYEAKKKASPFSGVTPEVNALHDMMNMAFAYGFIKGHRATIKGDYTEGR